jgi:hypothetical protein
MRIMVTESQIEVVRRLYYIGEIVNEVIIQLNNDIKNGGPGNKPDNFGVYENWVVNRASTYFKDRFPNINYDRMDFLMVVSEQFNGELRKGFNKVRKRK